MKCLQGRAYNIEENYIIGKIIKRIRPSYLLKNRNYIFVALKKTPILPFRAYILENFNFKLVQKGIPVVCGIGSEQLKEGDIVLLKKDGTVSIIYEKFSPHNALFVTNKCNLNCLTCPQPPEATEPLEFENNLKIIKLMDHQNTSTLAITGGEPTLLDKRFIELIKKCLQSLPETLVIILTNGVKFSDFEFTKKVAEVSNKNLFFAISLYSDSNTIHDKITQIDGSFYKTMKGFFNLALFKQKIEVRVVLNKLNIDRLPNIVEFIYRNFPFVIHVALMGLEVTGNARKNAELLWIDPFDYRKELLTACKYLNRFNINFSIYNHPLCIVPENLRKFCRKSISSWKNIFMEPCKRCSLKEDCGGFFMTSEPYFSKYITPL